MKVIDYRIIGETTPGELESDIRAMLKKGWQPIGGVCVVDARCYQAVVKLLIERNTNNPKGT